MVLRTTEARDDQRRDAPEAATVPPGVALAAEHANHPGAQPPLPHRRWVWVAYGVLVVTLAGYVAVVALRGSHEQWPWLDGGVVCGLEIAAALLCIYRAIETRVERYAHLALGLALLSWAVGDVLLNLESMGGADVPTPSAADAFYLAFYPLAYVATVLLLRGAMGRLSRPNWLDGAVAGLGAAAVCAAFAFHSLLHELGDSAGAVATNLAYPIGDLLLLSLVIGGTVLLSGRRTLPWLLLAGGVTLNVVGDTANLFQTSEYASRLGSDFNAVAWPTSIVLISMSVWLRSKRPDPLRVQRTAGFALPSIAAAGGLAILVLGTNHDVPRVALSLATATLIVVGVRLALSARDLRILTEQRHRQALTDELTGLGNRRHLFQALDAFFGAPGGPATPGRKLAFLFIDLDHFKEVNDSYGHPAGDGILRQLGPRLIGAVPATGMSVRVGGDELAVLLVDDDAEMAAAVAERILAEIRRPFEIQKTAVTVGASIGIAFAPSDAVDATELLWCADVAMYRAKLGDVAIAMYDQRLDGGEEKLRLVDELRDAVTTGDFVLHYQPQLDLRTGEIAAVESLIRWRHQRLGLVPPLKFIQLAEEAGLMEAMTSWVLNEALAQCAAWRAGGTTLSVAVNVTTMNLLEPGFADQVVGLLERHDLPPESLVLEITETSIITDFARSKEVIDQLRDLGLVVSIDDFGAGFTSLAYLSGLAVGELKLDRSFITALGEDGRQRELEVVRATIQLGHEMGLRVVAEGIEDAATLDVLRDLGCDLAQGYFIGRPMPAHSLDFHAARTAEASGARGRRTVAAGPPGHTQ